MNTPASQYLMAVADSGGAGDLPTAGVIFYSCWTQHSSGIMSACTDKILYNTLRFIKLNIKNDMVHETFIIYMGL